MPAKIKVATAVTTPAPSARKAKPKIVSPSPPVLSERDVDEMLERIRVRGAKISADLNALSARLGLS